MIDSVLKEGDELWRPRKGFAQSTQIAKFMNWLAARHGLEFSEYEDLWVWSVEEADRFWRTIWEYFDVISEGKYCGVVTPGEMFKARWFEGSLTNYAEHLLRHEVVAEANETALCHATEIRPLDRLSWQQLGAAVRKAATALRQLGIGPGDRVVSYMPNVPETVIAMMATTAIGAIWSSAAPEFGTQAVLDRFEQINPKLAFFTDGYTFNGKIFDRRSESKEIAKRLPNLKHAITLSYIGLEAEDLPVPSQSFESLLAGTPIAREDFKYTRVPPDHPLWILFSSGTTGLPKAIVHGHAGMIVEHLKVMSFHCNMGPGKRMFFYTTTGWMMWNSVVSALITGASAVLYDGSPVHDGLGTLWSLAEQSHSTLFGVSPTLVSNMKKGGIVPERDYDLSSIDTVMVGGAPSTPETFEWIYDNVSRDLWVTSQSGGTEICSSLFAGVPIKPVRAAEMQGKALGLNVQVWNESGEPVTDRVGELVVTNAFPSAPLFFWNDRGDQRYRDAYFNHFSGVWRHGDIAKINCHGGAYVYGRSDATLNRYGVRVGTAEIYNIVNRIPGIEDSLAICYEVGEGRDWMVLFVKLAVGRDLDETLRGEIIRHLRSEASPRHAPDAVHRVPEIPYTTTGKKMEVPVKRLFSGADPDTVASPASMTNPGSLDWFKTLAAQEIEALKPI
ncbi:acetoacetate--CoA ligase [Henriciella sp.]|uniref:acetoacetate--CoA ligase n=1 Tax=Henriciella sp. TaxID=1968823 RepID=UPI0026136CD7|nr:acetoacetate--CoA ligase [Henriciella sp.]